MILARAALLSSTSRSRHCRSSRRHGRTRRRPRRPAEPREQFPAHAGHQIGAVEAIDPSTISRARRDRSADRPSRRRRRGSARPPVTARAGAARRRAARCAPSRCRLRSVRRHGTRRAPLAVRRGPSRCPCAATHQRPAPGQRPRAGSGPGPTWCGSGPRAGWVGRRRRCAPRSATTGTPSAPPARAPRPRRGPAPQGPDRDAMPRCTIRHESSAARTTPNSPRCRPGRSR